MMFGVVAGETKPLLGGSEVGGASIHWQIFFHSLSSSSFISFLPFFLFKIQLHFHMKNADKGFPVPCYHLESSLGHEQEGQGIYLRSALDVAVPTSHH